MADFLQMKSTLKVQKYVVIGKYIRVLLLFTTAKCLSYKKECQAGQKGTILYSLKSVEHADEGREAKKKKKAASRNNIIFSIAVTLKNSPFIF